MSAALVPPITPGQIPMKRSQSGGRPAMPRSASAASESLSSGPGVALVSASGGAEAALQPQRSRPAGKGRKGSLHCAVIALPKLT